MSTISDIPAAWSLLELGLPSKPSCVVGVLLSDHAGILHFKVKDNWWRYLGDAGSRDWESLLPEFVQYAEKMGAQAFLDWLSSSGSHCVRISVPQEIVTVDPQADIENLYRRYVPDCQITSISRWSLTSVLRTCWERMQQSHARAIVIQLSAVFVIATQIISNISSQAELKRYDFEPIGAEQITPPPRFKLLPVGSPTLLQLELNPLFLSKTPVTLRRPVRKQTHKSLQIAQIVRANRIDRAPSTAPAPPTVELPEPGNEHSLLTLMDLPTAPVYSKNRSRLVRVLFLIASPFRVLAKQ